MCPYYSTSRVIRAHVDSLVSCESTCALITRLRESCDSAQRVEVFLQLCQLYASKDTEHIQKVKWAALDKDLTDNTLVAIDHDIRQSIFAKATNQCIPKGKGKKPEVLIRLATLTSKTAWQLRPYHLARDFGLSAFQPHILRCLYSIGKSLQDCNGLVVPWSTVVQTVYDIATARKEGTKSGRGLSKAKDFQLYDFEAARKQLCLTYEDTTSRRKLEAPQANVTQKRKVAIQITTEIAQKRLATSQSDDDSERRPTRHEEDQDSTVFGHLPMPHLEADESFAFCRNRSIQGFDNKEDSIEIGRGPQTPPTPVPTPAAHAVGGTTLLQASSQRHSDTSPQLRLLANSRMESTIGFGSEPASPHHPKPQGIISDLTTYETPSFSHPDCNPTPDDDLQCGILPSLRREDTAFPVVRPTANAPPFDSISMHAGETTPSKLPRRHNLSRPISQSALEMNLLQVTASYPSDSPAQVSAVDNGATTAARPAVTRDDVSRLFKVLTMRDQSTPTADTAGILQSLQPGRWLSASALASTIQAFNPDPASHRVCESPYLGLQLPHDEAMNDERGRRDQKRTQTRFYLLLLLSNAHWISAILDRMTAELEIYDPFLSNSCVSQRQTVTSVVERYAGCLGYSQGKSRPRWTPQLQPTLAQQNSHDCGIYVAARVIFRMHNQECTPSIIPEVWRRAFALYHTSIEQRTETTDFSPDWANSRLTQALGLQAGFVPSTSCVAQSYKMSQCLQLLRRETTTILGLMPIGMDSGSVMTTEEVRAALDWHQSSLASCPLTMNVQYRQQRVNGLNKEIRVLQTRLAWASCGAVLESDAKSYAQAAEKFVSGAKLMLEAVEKRVMAEVAQVRALQEIMRN